MLARSLDVEMTTGTAAPFPAEETQRGSETLRPLPHCTPNIAEAIENTARKYPEPISAALPPLCCGDVASKHIL